MALYGHKTDIDEDLEAAVIQQTFDDIRKVNYAAIKNVSFIGLINSLKGEETLLETCDLIASVACTASIYGYRTDRPTCLLSEELHGHLDTLRHSLAQISASEALDHFARPGTSYSLPVAWSVLCLALDVRPKDAPPAWRLHYAFIAGLDDDMTALADAQVAAELHYAARPVPLFEHEDTDNRGRKGRLRQAEKRFGAFRRRMLEQRTKAEASAYEALSA